MKNILIFAAIILVAFIVGAIINSQQPQPLAASYNSPEQRLSQDAKDLREDLQPTHDASLDITELPATLDLKEFRDYVLNKRGVVIDARFPIEYQLAHVPGAISIPRRDFKKAFRDHQDKLAANFEQPIVVYCENVQCEDSKLVAEALKKIGFSNVATFPAGWDAWNAAGLPKAALR